MIAIKQINQEIYQLFRRKDRENLIQVYEGAKNAILEIERIEKLFGICSYFSKETQMLKQLNKDYEALAKDKDKEILVLRSQIESMKELENSFSSMTKNYESLKSISDGKDKRIKELQNKINQVESSLKLKQTV